MNLKKYVIISTILGLLISIFISPSVRAETAEEWKIKGNEYLATEEYDKALECYEKSLAIDPCYGRSILNIGWTYKEMKEYDKSLEYYEKVIELLDSGKDTSGLPPGYPWVHKSYIFADLKRYDEALECSDKAMEIAPYEFYSPDCRGYVLLAMENYEEALEWFNKSIELNSEYACALGNKALALYNLEKYEEALACYDKALELAPDDLMYLTGKGNCYDDRKMFEEALICYDKALEVNPSYRPALINKAICLFSCSMNGKITEKYLEGKGYLDKVIEEDPDFQEIDIQKKYQGRITLLHVAVIYNNKDLAEFFISRGIDVDSRAARGFTPFHLACCNAFCNPNPSLNSPEFTEPAKEIAEYLLSEGADINAKMEDKTLLHFGVYDGKPEMIKFLLEHGADQAIKDGEGKTPLEMAEEMELGEIIEILKDR